VPILNICPAASFFVAASRLAFTTSLTKTKSLYCFPSPYIIEDFFKAALVMKIDITPE